MLTDLAPAKINLFLHVLGRREDGYHLLESLVGFADIGDDLSLEPGRTLSLVIEGPMAASLAVEDDNLVLRGARFFAEAYPKAETGRFHLVKRLPVASGIGGGSSDAATALRLLARLNGIALSDPPLLAIAGSLGADVPVCLEAKPRLMRGIGHELGPVLAFEAVPALLVNPGVAVETRAVFSAIGLKPGERFKPAARSMETGPAFARDTRNDLAAPARTLAPEIGDVLSALRGEVGCRVARMSGSGATSFALFNDEAAATAAAEALAARNSHWWVQPCRLQIPL